MDDPLIFLSKIENGKMTIEEAKETQKNLIDYLKMIRKWNKNQEQEEILKNLYMLFNLRNDGITFIKGYSSMILEVKRKGLKN